MTDRFLFSNRAVLVSAHRLSEDDDLVLEYPELENAVHVASVMRLAGADSGLASEALRQATDWADRSGEVLSLVAHASGPLTQEQLVSWYQRNGFEIASGKLMVRYPLTV